MRKLMVTIAGLLLLSTATLILAQRVTGDELFQQGLDQERGKRDIRAAIKIYERILKDFPSNRALAAKTLLELGECHEKLGEEKAQEYYQQVLTKYREQTEIVARARAHVRLASDEPAVSRSEFVIPEGRNLAGGSGPRLVALNGNGIDISPNGKQIAFVGSNNPGTSRGGRTIYLKSLDRFVAAPIQGTEQGLNPFFKPDGQWLGFFRIRNNNNVQAFELLKVSLVSAESPAVLFSQPLNDENAEYGASWGTIGRIVLGSFQDGLKWVPEGGGAQPQALTRLDPDADEAAHRFPHFLPDGSGVLFTVLRHTPTDPNLTRAQIWLHSFKTGKRNLLLENATDARLAPNDSLIFVREGKLFAARFDPKTLAVTGTPVEAVDGDGVALSRATGSAQYSVSQNGSLVYALGSVDPPINTSVVWVDEKGVMTPLEIPEKQYSSARVSPDGKSILISDVGAIWLYDIADRVLTSQFTSPGDALSPATWSPDGKRFAFSSAGNGPIATYIQGIQPSTVTRLLPHYFSPTWTPDGQLAVLGRSANSDRIGIYLVSPDNPNDIKPLVLNSAYDIRGPVFSPDGRYLAYVADDPGGLRAGGRRVGRQQLYVQAFPAGKPLAVDGATGSQIPMPVWSRDSQVLFGQMGTRGEIRRFNAGLSGFSRSTETIQIAEAKSLVLSDVASDGRYLMLVLPTAEDQLERNRKILPTTLRVVTNWSAELQRTWGKPTSLATVTQAPSRR